MAVDNYENAKRDTTGLRSILSDAASGIKRALGKSPDEKDDLKKALDTWTKELQLADRFFNDFEEHGLRAVHAYLDEYNESLPSRPKYKLNLFHANIDTLTSIMYAKLPKVEADRRFADPNDDVARVAAEMVTRILQNDMNDPEDRLHNVLKQALLDRLTAGLGVGRIRYCMEEEDAPDALPEDQRPEGYEVPKVKTDEWCDIEYVHWRDIRWSPCRTPAELRWVAFRTYMRKSELVARFGKEIADVVPLASRGPSLDPGEGKAADLSQDQDSAQAEVWEIWDKASKCVYWYVKGAPQFLDKKEDPMELDGFFPNPQPMVANVATLKYLPKPDYLLSEDLYEEINELECRIALLTKACKVVGVYPAAGKEIQRIMTEAVENQLVPVESWAMFSDRGGLKGQIDYFPVREVAEVLQILVIQQQTRINQLYQVTGMSDIIRGQASTQGVTATEQRIKAQFASTRMQSFQDEFAEFASELLNRKVQLIRKYYEPERIVRLSNILNTPDADLAEAAVQLIKNEDEFDLRVTVRADSMAQIDYDALKLERGEFMASVSSFLQASAPIMEQQPAAAPFLLQLLKFQLAGMKSANEMEGVIDQMVAALEQAEQAKAQQPPEPTPEEKAAQIKVQGQMQVEQAKAQATAQTDQLRAQTDVQIAQQEHELEMQKLQQEMQMQREEHQLQMEKMQAEIQMMMMKLGFQREESQMELQQKAQEQAIDAAAAEREAAHSERQMDMEEEHAERSFERDEDHAERSFEQQERHAEAAAKREAQRPQGDGE